MLYLVKRCEFNAGIECLMKGPELSAQQMIERFRGSLAALFTQPARRLVAIRGHSSWSVCFRDASEFGKAERAP